MDIYLLRKLCKKIFYNGWHSEYEVIFKKVLIDIDNIVTNAAQITYFDYSDKILNNIEDIKQNIYIIALNNAINDYLNFYTEEAFRQYIMKVATDLIY